MTGFRAGLGAAAEPSLLPLTCPDTFPARAQATLAIAPFSAGGTGVYGQTYRRQAASKPKLVGILSKFRGRGIWIGARQSTKFSIKW